MAQISSLCRGKLAFGCLTILTLTNLVTALVEKLAKNTLSCSAERVVLLLDLVPTGLSSHPCVVLIAVNFIFHFLANFEVRCQSLRQR